MLVYQRVYHWSTTGAPSEIPQVPHLEDPRGGSGEVPRRSLRRLGALVDRRGRRFWSFFGMKPAILSNFHEF